jgi:hypothetical protein
MSRLINVTEILVNPDHQMFGIADSSPDRDPDTPLPHDSPDGWLGRGESEVLVRTGQNHAQVALRLESWNEEPPKADDRPERSGDARLLMPTGEIGINLITGGWEPTEFTLPQAGMYLMRIDSFDCSRTAQDVEDIFEQFDDVSDPQFEEALQRLAGQERYFIRFWRSQSTNSEV